MGEHREGENLNTTLLLASQYNAAAAPLDAVAKDYLGLNPAQARRRAAEDKLPFPVFREGQKAPYLVRLVDLARWIDKAAEDARRVSATGEETPA